MTPFGKFLAVILLVLVSFGTLKLVANPPQYREYLVPAYQTGYSPSDDLLKQILTELRALREEMKQAGFSRSLPATDLASILRNRCASCHQDPVALTKGDGIILVEKDGSPSVLSVVERRAIVRVIDDGSMPKGSKLSAEEKKLFDVLRNP